MAEPEVGGGAQRVAQKKRRQRGSMIVLALTVLTPVMIAGGSLMTSLSAYGREVRFISSQRLAESVASSGTHSVLARLREDATLRGLVEIELRDGLALVTVTDLGTDQVDKVDHNAKELERAAEVVAGKLELMTWEQESHRTDRVPVAPDSDAFGLMPPSAW